MSRKRKPLFGVLPHGQHRQSNPAPHSNPAQRADPDNSANWTGRSTGVDPASGPDRTSITNFIPARKGASLRIGLPHATWRRVNAAPGGITYIGSIEPKSPLPRVVTTGEIIGYRWWRIERGFLKSIIVEDVWKPSVVMEGDVENYGVYAYSTRDNFELMMMPFGYGLSYGLNAAVGTISMWGDVVEHEFGYRATHARVRSIDFVIKANDRDNVERLRYRYGLGPKPLQHSRPTHWRCPECGGWYSMNDPRHVYRPRLDFLKLAEDMLLFGSAEQTTTYEFHYRPADPETI